MHTILLPLLHGAQDTLDLACPPKMLSLGTHPPLASHSPDCEQLLLAHLYDSSVLSTEGEPPPCPKEE